MHGVAHSLLQVIGTELVYEVPLARYYMSAAFNPGRGVMTVSDYLYSTPTLVATE